MTEDRRFHGTDHDLLVRIDERVSNFQSLVANVVGRLAIAEAEIQSIKSWRSESEGARQANARTIAVIVSLSSLLTAVMVKLGERVLG